MSITKYLALLACAVAASTLQADLLEELPAGFRYEAPNTWERRPNPKKISDPRIHLDTLYMKSERRLVIPCGFPIADKATAMKSIERMLEATNGARILDRHSSIITSKSGLPISRVMCSTSKSDPARILFYEFETHEQILVICVCFLDPSAEEESAATYDRLFATVALAAPEHLAGLPRNFQGKWYYDEYSTGATIMTVAQSDQERRRLKSFGDYLMAGRDPANGPLHGGVDINEKLIAESGAEFNWKYEVLSMFQDGSAVVAEVLGNSDLQGSSPSTLTLRITQEDDWLSLAVWLKGELSSYTVYGRERPEQK